MVIEVFSGNYILENGKIVHRDGLSFRAFLFGNCLRLNLSSENTSKHKGNGALTQVGNGNIQIVGNKNSVGVVKTSNESISIEDGNIYINGICISLEGEVLEITGEVKSVVLNGKDLFSSRNNQKYSDTHAKKNQVYEYSFPKEIKHLWINEGASFEQRK